MGYLRIGFHTATGGNNNGIGQYYFDPLQAAGLPIVLKSIGDFGICAEVIDRDPGETINHVVAFRPVGHDTPNYNVDPAVAFSDHWLSITRDDNFPAEYLSSDHYKRRIILTIINEPDKNRSDWLGRFCHAAGQFAVASGLRFALPSFAAGEPEESHWETPGMLAFLQYACQHPNNVVIDLHEYSYDVEDIWAPRNPDGSIGYWHIGRFKKVLDVCARHGFGKPNFVIGEWGWEERDIPAPGPAMMDVAEINDSLYDQYQVLGAFTWYLGPNYGNIHIKTNQLIQPVGQLALTYDGNPTPIPPPDPDPDNLLTNPSFAGYGSGESYPFVKNGLPIENMRVPVEWSFGFAGANVPNPLDPDGHVFGQPEAHVLHESDIPEDEWDDFIWGEDRYTYKIFGHEIPIRFKLVKTPTLSPGRYILDAPVWADLYKDFVQGKIWADDPNGNDGLVALRVNGVQLGGWVKLVPGVLNPVQWVFEVVAAGSAILEVVYYCPFPILNNGLWMDDWSLTKEEVSEMTLKEFLWTASVQQQIDHGVMLNPAAGLQQAIAADNMHIVTNEMTITYNDQSYTIQAAETYDSSIPRRVYVYQQGKPIWWFYDEEEAIPWPVVNARQTVNHPFAQPRDYDGDGEYDDRHEGLDIYAQLNDPIIAIWPGQVLWASDKRRGAPTQPSAYGKHVILGHPDPYYETWYCHLNSFLVSQGMTVGQGDIVGRAGSTGNSTGVHLHFNIRKRGHYAGPGFVPTDVVDPLPILRPGTVPAPIPPPPAPTGYDLAEYMTISQPRGILYEVLTQYYRDGQWVSGPQQRHQTQTNGPIFYHTKHSQWEELSYDANSIYRGIDTSPGDGRYYELRDSPESKWSIWAKRHMTVGEIFDRNPLVNFYHKSNCQLISSGRQASKLNLLARFASLTFFTGITLSNVIQLQWLSMTGTVLETYYYAKGYGLVGWGTGGIRAAISEIHAPGARPDNVREIIQCL
jgi:murein DD-endopeptidase MepM/ murein hydrolase activator NlpD